MNTRCTRMLVLCCCAAATALSACGLLIPDSALLNRNTQAVSTRSVADAATAAAPQTQISKTALPRISATTAAAPTQTAVVFQPTQPPRPTPTNSLPCNRIDPGVPFDVNYPEDSHVMPGQYFAKTWRLVNGGSCAWDRGYAAVWFSGPNLGIYPATAFGGQVLPGSVIELTVEMIAPKEPGTYQSNWKLLASDGTLFGIGPNGESPFWVRIVVEPVQQPTATPSTAPQDTPTVTASTGGALTLSTGASVDLDSGQSTQTIQDDLALRGAADGRLYLVPQNGALLGVVTVTAPGLSDCQSAAVADAPLEIQATSPDVFVCYRTSQGLPGRGLLNQVDLPAGQVGFEFLTWAAP